MVKLDQPFDAMLLAVEEVKNKLPGAGQYLCGAIARHLKENGVPLHPQVASYLFDALEKIDAGVPAAQAFQLHYGKGRPKKTKYDSRDIASEVSEEYEASGKIESALMVVYEKYKPELSLGTIKNYYYQWAKIFEINENR